MSEPEHVLSLSYGKDSLACLGAIEELGWPLDRIIHAEVWATDTIPADPPPMVEFKAKADTIIRERWGITVEQMKSNMDGIFTRQIFFFVAAEDFGPLPAQGGLVDIDGQKYVVTDATDEAGMYGITVQAARSGGRTGGRR